MGVQNGGGGDFIIRRSVVSVESDVCVWIDWLKLDEWTSPDGEV